MFAWGFGPRWLGVRGKLGGFAMFDQFQSFVGVIWSFLLAFRAAAEQQGEEPEEFIRFLQTKDGKTLVPGMIEFVVTARRGKRPGKSLAEQLAEWKKFYWKFFRHQLDVENICVPARQEGFDRLIVVAKGFTLNQIYAVMAKHFDCWQYTGDLDKAVPHNARDANRDGSYGVWLRDCQEADEVNKDRSAYDRWGTRQPIFKPEMPEITLAERMLYEIKFWDETGDHLDMDNLTICTGSRDAVGFALCMRCYSGEVKVFYVDPDNHYPEWRARSAVSPFVPDRVCEGGQTKV